MHAATRWLVTLFTMIAFWSSPALAGYRVDSQSIEIDQWRFIPIIEEDGVNPATVHSFVALLDDGAIEGANIAAIWYAKDANSPTGWESVAWEGVGGQDHWAVFGFVQGFLNLPADSWENWETDQPKPSVIESAPPPVGYYRGMFETDPLSEIVGDDPARDQLIDALVENAYAAASLEADRQSAEYGAAILGAMSKGIEDGIQGLDAMAAMDAQLVGVIIPCLPRTYPGTPSAWSPPPGNAGWVYDHTENSNGQPVACWYRRIYAQSRNRTKTHWYLDCSASTCFQTQTRTVEELGYVSYTFLTGCPAVLSGAPIIDNTQTVIHLNAWTPECSW